MNAFFATRICGYVTLTGGFIALGAAFGQFGLIIAGIILLLLAATLFHEALNYERLSRLSGDESKNSETGPSS